MASSGKKRTTMAKLNRESKLRERRFDKQARKDARKLGIVPTDGEVDGEATEELDERSDELDGDATDVGRAATHG
jgi:hypothetical protein